MITILDHTKDVSPPCEGQLLRYLDVSTLVNLLELDMEIDYNEFESEITLKELFDILDGVKSKYCVVNLSIIVPLHNNTVKRIAKRYSDIFFIFFFNETYYYNTLGDTEIKNFVCVSNGIENYKQNTDDRYFNYYILNTLIQGEYNSFLYYIFKSTLDLKRQKKYLFYNGAHKPYRLKVYELLLKHNLLDDGFYSYLAYAQTLVEKQHLFLDFFNMDKKQFDEYIKQFKIPYLCDSIDNTSQNIFFPFVNPPQYAFQSYINITTETTYIDDRDWVSTSEKSFKSFLSFNIPLIFGQRKLNTYLKDLGFDLFDDLFDTSEVSTREEMFNQFENNIKVIKNMSEVDLHNFYVEHMSRLENNFSTIITTAKNSLETIRNKCLEF